MALDHCHPQVVRALQKAGWIVEDEPYKLSSLEQRRITIDLEAWRGVNGSRQNALLIEVKCFPSDSALTTELYKAVGQYIFYRTVLQEQNLIVPLYLSIPEHIFVNEFGVTILKMFRENNINVVVIDIYNEVVKQWIDP